VLFVVKLLELGVSRNLILAGGVSRNLDSGRARVGLAPPLFPPHARPTRPSANSCLEFLASKCAAPASPTGARPRQGTEVAAAAVRLTSALLLVWVTERGLAQANRIALTKFCRCDDS
jgi:hypothetical protein